MRGLIVLVVAIASFSSVELTAAAKQESRSPKKPALRLVDREPFVVQGMHFKARERVTVTVNATGDRWTRTARATRAGTFTVSFGRLPITRCEEVAARAVGRFQSRATLKLALPECPVPVQPVA